METENKDWKPEVGKTAWLKTNHDIKLVKINIHYELSNQFEVQDRTSFWIETGRRLFPTPEAALASIKIYDLDGEQVAISRADAFLAEKVLGLQMENDILKKPVTTLAQAQMLLYEHGMILELSGLSPILIERGGAAIGGKSEPKQDEPCHVCQLTKFERRGKPCTEIRCPNQFVDHGGKSDQREGGC